MLSFHSSLSVPQDLMGCMFTLADIIQQLSSFELYFSGFAMSFLAIFILQPRSYQGSLLPSLFSVGTSDAFVINVMNRFQIRRICMESLEHN